jgi:hypothetical protein
MIALALALVLSLDPTVGAPASARSLAIQPVALRVEPAPAPMLQSVAVTVECTAFADGHVADCKVLDETHPGMGFAEAAIGLMRDVTVERSNADHQFAHTIQFMP